MLNGLILRGVERLGDHIGDEALGLVGIHFVELVVAALGVALGVETDGLHDQRDATRGDGLATIGDNLCDGGRVEPLEGLTGLGLTEATADELLLVGHNTEILVLLLHALFFGFIKPIGKAIIVLVAQLGIELLIVKIPGAWVVNIGHTETEPTAIAGVIGQEALLIARGTE